MIVGVEEGLIIDGKEGEWSTFFSDGRLLSKSYFKAGLLDGPFKSYRVTVIFGPLDFMRTGNGLVGGSPINLMVTSGAYYLVPSRR